jgi:hypothetical protein
MNYINPVEYSKKIMALMEDEIPEVEETIPMKGEMTMKERIAQLSEDDKTKLKEYIDAMKEIKKSIYELMNSDQMEEGGNVSNNLYLK